MRGELEDMSWPTPPPPRQIPVVHEFDYPRVVPIVDAHARALRLAFEASEKRNP